MRFASACRMCRLQGGRMTRSQTRATATSKPAEGGAGPAVETVATLTAMGQARALGHGAAQSVKEPGARTRVAKGRWGRLTGFKAGLAIMLLSLASGLATGLILTGLTPIVPTNEVVLITLLVNLVLIVLLGVVVVIHALGLLRDRREQKAGSGLHARIVGLFSIIAVVPAIVLAIFASISLDRGLDHWFSTRTKQIVNNSLEVAEAYVQEHGQVLRADILAMVSDLDSATNLDEVKDLRLSQQAGLREIPFAYLLSSDGSVVATAAQTASLKYVPPPPAALREAGEGHPVIISPGRTNRVAAIKKLETFPNLYVYVSRLVDQKVIHHLNNTQAGVREYSQLEERRAGVQIAFGLMYLMIAVTLLLSAVWIGLWFTNALVAPIQRLIGAAEEVSHGDLSVQVPLRRGEGDLGRLSSTFNRMTSQLRIQRDELVSANDEVSERRRFIEAVLSGVSAGIIGLDPHGRVTLMNRAASDRLEIEPARSEGLPIREVVPEFAALFRKARQQKRNDRVIDQITLRAAESEQILAVQITREGSDGVDHGYVITFDDITELVAAQRTSAWADVARRIAHEIKNPLTPIKLSAERLRRKYQREISSDPDVFERCVDTIIRRVDDIGRMADEFSSFAKMPDPRMEPTNVTDVAREVVFLFQNGNPDIAFGLEAPDEAVIAECDRRMMSQVLTNLVKNATEGIAAVGADGKLPEGYSGVITVRLTLEAENLTIEVTDNGCGLPKRNRLRLVEPYMTTRAKGTGIGLAVVKKVMEQHHGRLVLDDAPEDVHGRRGACIRLILPLRQPETAEPHQPMPDGSGKTGPQDGRVATLNDESEPALGEDEVDERPGANDGNGRGRKRVAS
ncbi:MAG: HAMP domain-containing protein [Rhizobiales bacterium]|nr:HAMP domain-containing protein [Hyphomicrobiales bacterium]